MLAYAVPNNVIQERTIASQSSIRARKTESVPPSPDARFDNLLVAPTRVVQMLGRRSPGEVRYEDSEQSFARRHLLNVEKIALHNKALAAESEAAYLEEVGHQLHNTLLKTLRAKLTDPEYIFRSVLALDEKVVALLDALTVSTTSISKIEPHAAALPWLYDELLSVANKPKFRRRDAKGRLIPLESLRSILSFLGIDNLRLLLPSLILRRTLPQITDPYPEIKSQLNQYIQGAAVTLRELAKNTSVEPHIAFTYGIMGQLGRCAVTRLYFRLYEQIHRQMLERSQQIGRRKLHSALLKMVPSADHLIAVQNEFSEQLSADLLAFMDFKSLPCNEVYQQSDVLDSLQQLQYKAKRYARIRMLHQHRFVEKEESVFGLKRTGLSQQELETLKAINIFQLPLIAHSEFV